MPVVQSMLVEFETKHDQKMAKFYIGNESGRKLRHPQLMQLLEDASDGDILLIESIDRLTRLTSDEWK